MVEGIERGSAEIGCACKQKKGGMLIQWGHACRPIYNRKGVLIDGGMQGMNKWRMNYAMIACKVR